MRIDELPGTYNRMSAEDQKQVRRLMEEGYRRREREPGLTPLDICHWAIETVHQQRIEAMQECARSFHTEQNTDNQSAHLRRSFGGKQGRLL